MKKKQIQKEYKAKLIDFGIYSEKKKGEAVPDAKTIGGEWYVVEDEQLVEQTDEIKGEQNLLFGIRYKVKSPRKNEELELQNILEMPPRYDEHFKRTISSTQFTCETVDDMLTISMFSFDEEVDLIKGLYTFIVQLKGVELLRKTIKII